MTKEGTTVAHPPDQSRKANAKYLNISPGSQLNLLLFKKITVSFQKRNVTFSSLRDNSTFTEN